jgi:hypothetical protein
VMGFFKIRSPNYLPGLALNCSPLDLCLLNSRITGMSHQLEAILYS